MEDRIKRALGTGEIGNVVARGLGGCRPGSYRTRGEGTPSSGAPCQMIERKKDGP